MPEQIAALEARITALEKEAYIPLDLNITDKSNLFGLIKRGMTPYSGFVYSSGLTFYLPQGWTASLGGSNTYTITHNLNLDVSSPSYVVVASAKDVDRYAVPRDCDANSFQVMTYTAPGGSASAANFYFIMLTI